MAVTPCLLVSGRERDPLRVRMWKKKNMSIELRRREKELVTCLGLVITQANANGFSIR
jgi:hypothetical protein